MTRNSRLPVVAVILPFYQSTPGLLEAAVRSVQGQTAAADIRVIVVDDGSPRPAMEELTTLQDVWPGHIRCLHQENAGPAVARNRGLDACGEDVDLVAFLDTDDTWRPDHLSIALRAFQHGCSAFFANYTPYRSAVTGFEFSRWDQTAADEVLDRELSLYRVTTNLFDLLLRNNVIATSSFVYDFRAHSDLRFVEDLWIGEDLMFFLDLVWRGVAAGYTTRLTHDRGAGVNIYDGAAWGTAKWLNIRSRDINFRKRVLARFELEPAQRFATQDIIRRLREALVLGTLSALRRREISWSEAGSLLQADRGLLAGVPSAMRRAVARRIQGGERSAGAPRG